jgi:arylsulfatase A-like enzyme
LSVTGVDTIDIIENIEKTKSQRMNLKPFCSSSLALIAILCFSGCSKPQYSSVLLITVDGLRADMPGCYGGPAATPALDRLARESVRFDKLTTPAPLTLPAHASLLTGLNPPEHGLRIDAFGGLPPTIVTMTESFAAVGFQTAAFVSSPHLAPIHGLDRGFAVYHAPVPGAEHAILFQAPLALTPDGAEPPAAPLPPPFPEHTDLAVAARFRSWFTARQPDAPWFAWVQFSGTTLPRIDGSGAPIDAADTNAYLKAVAAVDAAIGSVLDALNATPDAAKTVVLVTASSGEALGENGEYGHGLLLRAPTRRVPGLLRLPSRRGAGTRISYSAGLVQAAPTLLDLAGVPPSRTQAANWSSRRQVSVPAPIPIPEQLGKTFQASRFDSLAPYLLGYAAGTDTAVYSETEHPFALFRWRTPAAYQAGNWVYIDSEPPEIYDLSDDPMEQKNLAETIPDSVLRLSIRFERLRDAMATRAPVDTSASNAVWQALSAWGQTGRPNRKSPAERARPQIGILAQENKIPRPAVDTELAAAAARLHPLLPGTNQAERVRERINACIARSPQTARFLLWRATLNAADTNLLPDVIADLSLAVDCDPDDDAVVAWLGRSCFAAGDWVRGLAHLRRARKLNPANATALELLPRVLQVAANATAQAEDIAMALQLVEELITFQPTLDNRMWRVRLLIARNRSTQAKQELRNILYANPDYYAAKDMLEKIR